MTSFNVGDDVTCIKDDGLFKVGMKGVINDRPILGQASVQLYRTVTDSKGLVYHQLTISEGRLELTQKVVKTQEPTNSFKVGDSVVLTEACDAAPKGTIGVIVQRYSSRSWVLDLLSDHPFGHTGDGYGPPGSKRYYNVAWQCLAIRDDFHREKTSWTREEIEHCWNCVVAVGKGS